MKKIQRNLLIVGFLTVLFVSVFVIQFSGFYLVNGGDGGDLPDYDTLPSVPVLNDIQPNPDTDDDIVNLDWSDSSSVVYYNVYRRKYGATVEAKIAIARTISSFTDIDSKENGVYYYKIEAVNNIGAVFSDEVSVNINIPELEPEELVYPTNPSIIINNNDETTNSFVLTLTLSCNDADEMSFQISSGIWTSYIPYVTTHTLELSEGYLSPAGTFKIEVVFKNNDGTTKDADPNIVIADDIIYDVSNDGEDDGNGDDDEPEDYTLLYILLGTLGILIIPAVVLTRKKK